jgi:hypothetical protein
MKQPLEGKAAIVTGAGKGERDVAADAAVSPGAGDDGGFAFEWLLHGGP